MDGAALRWTRKDSLPAMRQSDLWFSDGNLILVAGNTSFRIYAQFLAAKSQIFAEMQPSGSMEGTPIVELVDSDADVEAFLKAVFDSDFFMPPPSPINLTTLLAILRTSHKYDVHFLVRRALRHLDTMYPTTLSEFLDIPSAPHIQYPELTLVGHLSVLKVAMDVNARWLLPAVHYAISCSPLRQILSAGASWSSLCEQTQFFILTTHAWRLHRFEKMHEGPLTPVDERTCGDAHLCLRTQATYATRLVAIVARDQPLDPIRFWDEPGVAEYMRRRCASCGAGMRERIRETQEMVWGALPQSFGCDEWPVLRQMRDMAMARVD